MAVPVRGQIGLDVPIVSGSRINGTNQSDTLDDLSRNADGGVFDPGTDDTIFGYAGADIITIHNGNDTVYGDAGQNFIIDRGTGNDRMFGANDSDQFVVGAGTDLIDGGEGIDSVSYAESQTPVALDLATGFAIADGIDTLVSIEIVTGSSGNDRLFGDGVGNSMNGMDGDDRMEGRAGDDFLFGEAGNDTLLGQEGGDLLFGGEGNDTLDGGIQADHLHGGLGHDILIGGEGPDTFFVDSWRDVEIGDTIKDFEQGADRIDVRDLDASANFEGDQAFNFDETPDGWLEELRDALNDSGAITRPGPTIHGEPGEIEYKHVDGDTYVFLSTADAVTEWSIMLEGTYDLTVADFIL
jgi:Ca2+-binding RTX toxin-like protein